MVLELHIWGPAFSLPSIDPHCLAAVFYLARSIPKDEWVLICSDDSLSPTCALPALRDGSELVGGFWNIVNHLSKKTGCEWDLDSSVQDPRQKAKITAFSSFVDINGRLVLDLTLFVSSENYTSTTRPAYSSLLQWPDQWFVTPQKRSAALARTDHLGFSLLDLDNMNDEQWKNMSTSAGSGAIPQSLKWSSPTVTDLVKQPQHATRFRLDALADGFFRPLHQLLGKKRYMLSANKPCSLDCVAYAYLALAYTPQFPHAWAAEAMKARYPELCDYVHRLSKESFGGPVSVSHALGSEAGQSKPHAEGVSSLPWGKPDSRGFSAAALSLVRGALHSMPSAGHFQTDKMVLDNAGAEEQSQSAVSDTSAKNLNIVPVLIGVGSTLAAVGAYLHYFRVPSNPDPRRKTLLELGEAGAMLDLATFGAYGPIHMEEMPRQGRIPVGVELDVEVQNHDVNELGKA